jgi:MOSC domain-containing protein YiiM
MDRAADGRETAAPANLVARVLPAEGATGWRGRLVHIHVAAGAGAPMRELAAALCLPGQGLEGDRYALGTGSYSGRADVRDVTLIELETLAALARNDPPVQGGPILLAPHEHRRNLTVQGVPLNHLVGQDFRVGEVVLRGGRLNFPCKYLEELLGRRLVLPLYNRSGLNCSVVRGGTIRAGDVVERV